MNKPNPRSWEEVRDSYLYFLNECRNNFVMKKCEQMTPIENIVFVTLIGLIDEIGSMNTRFALQYKIDQYTVDFLLIYEPFENSSISKKIVIECDGHDFHEKTKTKAAQTKKRDRHLVKKGYIVLHYTGSEIVNDRLKIYTDILELIIPDNQKENFGIGLDFKDTGR